MEAVISGVSHPSYGVCGGGQSRLIRPEPCADELRERGFTLRRGQGQGLLEMDIGFSRFPLTGQRDS